MAEKNLIIGDIHGCGDELEDVISQSAGEHNLFCVGDLFDRAPKGVKVWELIHKHNILCTMGNHEVKMLNYLRGERGWLSANYYYFLNDFAERYNLADLVNFLERMPLLLDLGLYLVTHAAADVENPLREDKSINCYGRYENEEIVWPEHYKLNKIVCYGHRVYDFPRVEYSEDGFMNSIGLDTAACHGRVLTGYCHEENRLYVAKSKKDYFSEIRGKKIEPSEAVTKFRKEYAI